MPCKYGRWGRKWSVNRHYVHLIGLCGAERCALMYVIITDNTLLRNSTRCSSPSTTHGTACAVSLSPPRPPRWQTPIKTIQNLPCPSGATRYNAVWLSHIFVFTCIRTLRLSVCAQLTEILMPYTRLCRINIKTVARINSNTTH